MNEELEKALEKGDFDKVRDLVRNEAKINVLNKNRENAMNIAVRTNNLEIAQLLIENDAIVNKDALTVAVRMNYLEMAQLLLGRGVSTVKELHVKISTKNMNFELTELLLKHYHILNMVESRTSFYLISTKSMRFVELIEKYSHHQTTDIKHAVRTNDYDIVRYVITNLKEDYSEVVVSSSCIDSAIMNLNPDILSLLIDNGAFINFNVIDRFIEMFSDHEDEHGISEILNILADHCYVDRKHKDGLYNLYLSNNVSTLFKEALVKVSKRNGFNLEKVRPTKKIKLEKTDGKCAVM